jgi:hypothetical protein
MRKFKIRRLSRRKRKALAVLILLELSAEGSSTVQRQVRGPIRPLLRERNERGEFAVLVEQARNSYEDTFSEYFHMRRGTFDKLLAILQVKCYSTSVVASLHLFMPLKTIGGLDPSLHQTRINCSKISKKRNGGFQAQNRAALAGIDCTAPGSAAGISCTLPGSAAAFHQRRRSHLKTTGPHFQFRIGVRCF